MGVLKKICAVPVGEGGFGEWLSGMCKTLGVTQTQLAEELGVSKSSLTHYITGYAHMKRKLLGKLTSLLQSRIDGIIKKSPIDLGRIPRDTLSEHAQKQYYEIENEAERIDKGLEDLQRGTGGRFSQRKACELLKKRAQTQLPLIAWYQNVIAESEVVCS